MYPEAAKKMWAIFFWFYPLKQLFFSEGVQISREGVLLAQEPPLWKSAAQHFWWTEHKIWWAVWKHFFGGWYQSQQMDQSPWNDIIEVKNNESLMQCYHLMVVVNKMWSSSGGTPSLEIGTPSLEKWRSLRKRSPWPPKKWNFGPPKKILSSYPSGHGLFAKNCIKIGLVWPQQLHFWSISAY